MFWGTEMPLKGFKGEIVSYLVYKIYYFGFFGGKGFHYVSLFGTHYVDQTGLSHPPTSVSEVLGLKV